MKHAQMVVLSVGFALLTVMGCGGSSGPARLPVYGKVTTEESEKLSGTITFVPAAGHGGPGAVASLVEGGYRFDTTNGPLAGPHVVTISRAIAKPNFSRPVKDAPGNKPPREWTRTVDVPSQAPYQLDFNLD